MEMDSVGMPLFIKLKETLGFYEMVHRHSIPRLSIKQHSTVDCVCVWVSLCGCHLDNF